ncbi:matrixin family metalloprotease [Levilactobacillus angrenensis]|uniref:Matrixin family metalloprotease n=1 Tax=Levilactobacillus angrenensis TaxID=2486020 RepID=A0ABW1U9C6_9LACO|nr:matrixin family metalloprotease [Levilactobacillus angrenensis]
MHKTLILLTGCLVLLGGISAQGATKNPTPANKYRYAAKKAAYYNKSTSKYYRSIWTTARKTWNQSKAFTWSATKNKKSRSFTTTVAKNSGIWTNATGMAYNGLAFDKQGHQTGAAMYLNRTVLKKYRYTKKQRTHVAIHEMGHALGLSHNNAGSISVMNPSNRVHSLRNVDIKGAKKVYTTPISPAKALATAAKPSLTVDHLKDYSNNISGVERLVHDAGTIVEGTIIKSVPHHRAPKNYYTTQTIRIADKFKGQTGQTLTFTQGGTPQMAVTDSVVLHPGEDVVVMLGRTAAGKYYAINDGQGLFLDTHTSNGHELFEHVSDHVLYTEDMLH